jgi:hypothetical protein
VTGIPPLRARLHWYQLSASEFALLTAMCEACSDGSVVWAAIPRLATYAKLSRRHVDRLIKGYVDPRTGKRIKGLIERGILTLLAPPGSRKRTAIYRINEDALHLHSPMSPYLAQSAQRELPGIVKPPKTGIAQPPITDAPPPNRTPCPPTLDTVSTDTGHRVHSTLDTVSTDSKAFDPSTPDSKPVIHHGDAALNLMPTWDAFKEQLRSELSSEEWDLWVRPMQLLKTMPASSDQKHILAALPPNGRIQSAAIKRLPMMRELLAPAGLNISLTRYPDEYEIQEAKKRYDVDMAPKPWKRES